MSEWNVTIEKGFTCTNPVFIEGLPGIGNVGKIAVDYLVEKLQAKKVGSFFSRELPSNVFISEDNLVALPTIDLYHYKKGKQDFLFLTGDAQPAKERASYTFSQTIIDVLDTFGKPELVTLGGIGLEDIPEQVQVFITGNNKQFINSFKGVNKEIYGKVGVIYGVTGLLLGLAKTIPAVGLLAETHANPFHIGLLEAKELLKILETKYGFIVDYKDLDEEIALINEELLGEEPKQLPKHLGKLKKYQDLNYIG